MNEQALLQAILDVPEDDAPRLVYADWLDEHGGPEERARAEIIRLEVAHARLPSGDPRVEEDEERWLDLVENHVRPWMESLGGEGISWDDNAGPTFERGFPAKADAPAFAEVKMLYVAHNDLTDASAWALAQSPHLPAECEVYIHGNRLTSAGAAALRGRFRKVYTEDPAAGPPGAGE
jgi:uncharacterized protein (TIGR02996 family)